MESIGGAPSTFWNGCPWLLESSFISLEFIQFIRIIGGGHGNLLQFSCLENPMDRGALQATVHGGHKELDMADWKDGC